MLNNRKADIHFRYEISVCLPSGYLRILKISYPLGLAVVLAE